MPIGAYTRGVLGRLGDRQRKAILANVRSEEPDVGGIAAKLDAGRRRRGLRVRHGRIASEGRLKAIDLPAALQPKVAYGVAVVKGAPPRAAERASSPGS